MSKTKNNTAVALTSDSTVPNVLAVLEQKIKDLKHIETTVYKCNKSLEGFGDIQSEMLVPNLIRAYGYVKTREDVYNNAAKELGITTYPAFEISGGNAEAWKHDILLRKAIIEHADTLNKLNEYKTKMSQFLSVTDQKEMLMKEMSDFLGSK